METKTPLTQAFDALIGDKTAAAPANEEFTWGEGRYTCKVDGDYVNFVATQWMEPHWATLPKWLLVSLLSGQTTAYRQFSITFVAKGVVLTCGNQSDGQADSFAVPNRVVIALKQLLGIKEDE
jgi:hypothetical protein